MTTAIYCISHVSSRGVATLSSHTGWFVAYSHIDVLAAGTSAKSCAAAPARSEARTAAAAQRAATPPLSNTGINGGAA